MGIQKINKTYHLRRRVPKRYEGVESREVIIKTLKTDSETVATQKAETVWAHLIDGWEARLAGVTEDADERFEAARNLAEMRGFRYMEMNDVAKIPSRALKARIDAIATAGDNEQEVAAILGGTPRPSLTVTKALDEYWTLAREKTLGKSQNQLRVWRNPRIKALKNFTGVVGDKPIGEITRDDMLDFREWWLDRIEAGEVKPSTANKDFTHLGEILKTVNVKRRLKIDLPLGDLSFKENEKSVRLPFSTDWIRDKILAPGALDRMNGDARAILLGMVNTGYRPSEGANLTADTIHIEANIPHISIEADGRVLKTGNSKRVIPLLGVSLDAIKEYRDGFPRYRDSPNLSATVNKYLRENGLTESVSHTMYSLRHAFEDRMLAANVDERIRCDVFGHKLKREKYGSGASLEQTANALKPAAL